MIANGCCDVVQKWGCYAGTRPQLQCLFPAMFATNKTVLYRKRGYITDVSPDYPCFNQCRSQWLQPRCHRHIFLSVLSSIFPRLHRKLHLEVTNHTICTDRYISGQVPVPVRCECPCPWYVWHKDAMPLDADTIPPPENHLPLEIILWASKRQL